MPAPATRPVAIARILLCAVTVVSLIARYIWGLGSAAFEPGNFFAYVTIQSNIAFAVTTFVAAVAAVRRRPDGALLTAIRAGVLTCTVTSGSVFALLVWQSSQRGIRVDVPWSDILLHFVLPVLALVDWAIVPRPSAKLRIVVFVLGYVLVWGGLTVLRGRFVQWYPYYFLDPRQLESPVEFVVAVAIALAAFLILGVAIVKSPHAGANRLVPSVHEGGQAPDDESSDGVGIQFVQRSRGATADDAE